MTSGRPKTLLLVLWIAVQLVLAPVTGARSCAGQAARALGGAAGACCGSAAADLGAADAAEEPVGCCCGGEVRVCHDADAPDPEPEQPDGCDCSHAPAPEGLPEPIAGLGTDGGAADWLSLRAIDFVPLAAGASRGARPPRTGPPPGGSGRLLHVRYCVFLI